MKRGSVIAGLAALSVQVMADAHEPEAQGEAPAASRFELTPFIGYQFGGALDLEQADTQATQDADVAAHGSYALAFDLNAAPGLQYEFFYSRQPTRIEAPPVFDGAALDVEYLHFGGTAEFGESQFLKPYSVGSIGITRLSIDAPGASEETPFSISLGVGMRVPVKPRFDIRFEARAFLSFLQSDTTVSCGSGSPPGGTCILRGSGSLFTQYALLVGASFSF